MAESSTSGRPRAAELPEHLRGWVQLRITAGHSYHKIAHDLEQHHDVYMTAGTLRRRIAELGLQQRITRPRAEDTPLLRQRITHAFNTLRLTDDATSRMLSRDGIVVGPRRIARLRKAMGLYKRGYGSFLLPKTPKYP